MCYCLRRWAVWWRTSMLRTDSNSRPFDSAFDSGLINQEDWLNFLHIGPEAFTATMIVSKDTRFIRRGVTMGLTPLLAACYMLESCLAFYSTLKMEATYSSKISIGFTRTTQRYIQEDRCLNCRCKNLRTLELSVQWFRHWYWSQRDRQTWPPNEAFSPLLCKERLDAKCTTLVYMFDKN
jgi:hypothetical protein